MTTDSKRNSRIVAGADAARIGKRKVWAVVLLGEKGVTVRVVERGQLDEVADEVDLLAVDIPIGLPDQEGVSVDERGRRRADVEAKQVVHPQRRRSVFWVPRSEALEQETVEAARQVQASL